MVAVVYARLRKTIYGVWDSMIALGVFCTALMVSWWVVITMVPPKTLLEPVRITLDEQGNVTFYRLVKGDMVRAIYVDRVIGANGTVCNSWGIAPYESKETETDGQKNIEPVRFRLGGEMDDCVRHPPVSYMPKWYPLLFGFIPLRPVSLTAEIERDQE